MPGRIFPWQVWLGTILSLFHTLSSSVLIETGTLVAPCYLHMRKQRHRWRWGSTFGTTWVRADCSPGALSLEHIWVQKWSGTKQRGWEWKCIRLPLSTSEGHFSPAAQLTWDTVLLLTKTEWAVMSFVLSNYGSTLLNFPYSLKEGR